MPSVYKFAAALKTHADNFPDAVIVFLVCVDTHQSVLLFHMKTQNEYYADSRNASANTVKVHRQNCHDFMRMASQDISDFVFEHRSAAKQKSGSWHCGFHTCVNTYQLLHHADCSDQTVLIANWLDHVCSGLIAGRLLGQMHCAPRIPHCTKCAGLPACTIYSQ